MAHSRPPFRADHVGSLLRSKPLQEARAKREKSVIGAEQLRDVENREVEKIIRKQEEIGLKLATDGEFRRAYWHFDFFSMLDGVELYELDHGIQFQGVQSKPQSIRITGRPLALASALEKLDVIKRRARPLDANPVVAALFIVNPLHGEGLTGLFSAYSAVEARIRRLEGMVCACRPEQTD